MKTILRGGLGGALGRSSGGVGTTGTIGTTPGGVGLFLILASFLSISLLSLSSSAILRLRFLSSVSICLSLVLR